MFRLHAGIRAGDAATTLRRLATDATNLAAWGSGPAANQWSIHRDRFLKWADDTERHLRSLSNDPRLVSMVHTERYWHIRQLGADSALPHQLINTEADVQARSLTQLADELDERATALSAGAGAICALDTNVLLHCKPVGEIPWPELLDSDAARLVLPLRVIEELDAKKYSRRNDLARRATNVLAALEEILREDATSPAQVTIGVTVEVLLRQHDSDRLLDADAEILRACRDLQQVIDRPVTIATGDTSMKLRARIASINVLALPSNCRQPLSPAAEEAEPVASPN